MRKEQTAQKMQCMLGNLGPDMSDGFTKVTQQVGRRL